MHNIYYQGLSGEHRCPLGYLFFFWGGGGGGGMSTTFILFAFRYVVVVLARWAGEPSRSKCIPLRFLNEGKKLLIQHFMLEGSCS